jgi:hypothetical protein
MFKVMKVLYMVSVPVTALSFSTGGAFLSLYRTLHLSNIVEFNTVVISILDMALHSDRKYNRGVHDNNCQPLFPVGIYLK